MLRRGEGTDSFKLVNGESDAMRNLKVQAEAGETTALPEKLN